MLNKKSRMLHIGRISRFIFKSVPITNSYNRLLFKVLQSKFESFQKWPETKKIERTVYEKALNGDPELVDAYLDVYSNQADFYLVKISYDDFIFSYWIMVSNDQIVFLFYNHVYINIK